jgi:hypothetical protein
MAVIGTEEENCGGNSFAAGAGKVRGETTEVAITCNSFWDEEGTGAAGAEGVFGAAQHAILQQWSPLQQQDFIAGEVPGIATTGYAARTNPSSNATANLVTFKAMLFSANQTTFAHWGRGCNHSFDFMPLRGILPV